MVQTVTLHGGVVFVGKADHVLNRFCRITAAALEDAGQVVDRVSILTADQARITSGGYSIKLRLMHTPEPNETLKRARRLDAAGHLNLHRRQPPHHRLVVTMSAADGRGGLRDMHEKLLLVMLFNMADATEATHVEWLSPETRLPADRFMATLTEALPEQYGSALIPLAFQPFDPNAGDEPRLYGAGPSHGASEDEGQSPSDETLFAAFRDEDGAASGPPDSDIRRLASWAMTGVVASVSLPVGASLAAVNLIRGEDFRLNTHVLVLAGFIATLSTGGALGRVVMMFVA